VTAQASAVARAAAERLAPELGDGLPFDVETALAADHGPGAQRYLDPISLAGLVVAVASFAWTVYRDLRATSGEVAPDVLARTVRVELRATHNADPALRDRIVEVVVEEVTRRGDEAGNGA